MKIAKSQKHRLGFNEASWNDTQLKIKGIEVQMKRLHSLMKEASISTIDVNQLLNDPYKTILPHTKKEFQELSESLSSPELLNWHKFPVHLDIIEWAKRNSSNVDLLNYHRYYNLNGTLTVDKTKIDELQESFTRYTEGEKQAAIFSMVNQAVEILNSAQNVGGSWVDPYSGEADLIKPFRRKGNQYTVNEEFIRKF